VSLFQQAAAVTLRILLFRAGPQDLPFSAELTRIVAGLMIAAAWLQYQLTLTPGTAAIHAVATLAVWVVFTRALLQMRGLLNRFQQTVTALLATTLAITLLLLAPLSALAPHMIKLAENPELMRTQPLPALPAFAVLVLSVWNFVVSANIYRHALDVRPALGAAAALVAALITVTLSSAITSILTR